MKIWSQRGILRKCALRGLLQISLSQPVESCKNYARYIVRLTSVVARQLSLFLLCNIAFFMHQTGSQLLQGERPSNGH